MVSTCLRSVPGCHVSRAHLLKLARATHASTGRVKSQNAERETAKEEKVGHVAHYYRLPGFLS